MKITVAGLCRCVGVYQEIHPLPKWHAMPELIHIDLPAPALANVVYKYIIYHRIVSQCP